MEPGARLPERVDVVIETVGAATFDHSLKSAAPGGPDRGLRRDRRPPGRRSNLRRVFAMQLEILGTSMGTPDELAALLAFCVERERTPGGGHRRTASAAVADAFARLHSGEVFGKVVVDHTA